jgi:hypothetical protein
MYDSRGIGSSSLLNPLPLVDVRLVPTLLREPVEGALDPETEAQLAFHPVSVRGGATAAAFWFLEMDFAVSFLGSGLTLMWGRWADAFPAVRAIAYIASSS